MARAIWRHAAWCAVAGALALAGCSSEPADGAVATSTTASTVTDAPVSATTTSTRTAPPGTIDPATYTPPRADPNAPGWRPGPDDLDVPNPIILLHGAGYIMFSTQTEFFGGMLNIPWRGTMDLATWDYIGDALPELPPWAALDATWAPDVMETDDGWVLYFTARLQGTELQCIGHAVADEVVGPYVPFDDPIVCPTERGGAIDPRTFIDDDGSRWLLWKSDDNWDTDREDPSSIYVQRLSDDGLTLAGEPVVLLDAGGGWEGHIVEAPDMVRGPDGRLWMFYSGGWFNQTTYGLGVAFCESVTGPCVRHGEGRFLGSNAQGEGPGEASVLVDHDGSIWLAYAPWAQRYRSYTPRPVSLVRIGFDADGPYLADSTR